MKTFFVIVVILTVGAEFITLGIAVAHGWRQTVKSLMYFGNKTFYPLWLKLLNGTVIAVYFSGNVCLYWFAIFSLLGFLIGMNLRRRGFQKTRSSTVNVTTNKKG